MQNEIQLQVPLLEGFTKKEKAGLTVLYGFRKGKGKIPLEMSFEVRKIL